MSVFSSHPPLSFVRPLPTFSLFSPIALTGINISFCHFSPFLVLIRLYTYTIASVAEPNGNGDAKTIALALARRPGPILSAIRERGLELPRWWEDVADDDRREEDFDDADDDRGAAARSGGIANERGGSGIMRPPPLDPLHNLEVVIGGSYIVGRLVSVPGRRYDGGKSSRGSGAVAPLLDYETRGEVVAGGDGDGPAGYFRYDFRDDEIPVEGAATGDPSTVGSVPRTAARDVDGDGGEVDELLAEAERDFAKAAAQAEAAAAEAKRKEEKMKMCEYSPDLSMECGLLLRMLNNSKCPFSQCKGERMRPWQHGGKRTRANLKITNDIPLRFYYSNLVYMSVV